MAVYTEQGLGGDFLRTGGRGADFILGRNAGSVSLALDHFRLWSGESRVGWSLVAPRVEGEWLGPLLLSGPA
jgi:hypothetical protein